MIPVNHSLTTPKLDAKGKFSSVYKMLNTLYTLKLMVPGCGDLWDHHSLQGVCSGVQEGSLVQYNSVARFGSNLGSLTMGRLFWACSGTTQFGRKVSM